MFTCYFSPSFLTSASLWNIQYAPQQASDSDATPFAPILIASAKATTFTGHLPIHSSLSYVCHHLSRLAYILCLSLYLHTLVLLRSRDRSHHYPFWLKSFLSAPDRPQICAILQPQLPKCWIYFRKSFYIISLQLPPWERRIYFIHPNLPTLCPDSIPGGNVQGV